MRTQVFEGSKQQIARQVASVEGNVVRTVVYVEEPADAAELNVSELEAELDALMALGSENSSPADVSREAIYSPEHP